MTLATQKEQQTIRYEGTHGEVSLSVNFVRTYFCPKASNAEAFAFMKLCEFHRLNPFLREVYLVKYGDNDPAQCIIGYQAWTQRAEKDPNYQGFKAGLILAKEGAIERREGSFYMEGETVAGGWCQVHLTNRSVQIEVSIHEYIQKTRDGRPNRFWAEKPGTMIRKVAIAQAHREAFPSLFAGLYDQAEIGPDSELPEGAVVIEGIGIPQETETGEILPPDESSDNPLSQRETHNGLTYQAVLERAEGEGVDREAFEIAVLGCSLETFQKRKGASPEVADTRLSVYLQERGG